MRLSCGRFSPGQSFISGAGFPDLMIFTAETLRSGTDGVRAIGWFGNDWSVERGDIVWNEGKGAMMRRIQ